ncbi:unnamed protein product [Boreogadus saida]
MAPSGGRLLPGVPGRIRVATLLHPSMKLRGLVLERQSCPAPSSPAPSSPVARSPVARSLVARLPRRPLPRLQLPRLPSPSSPAVSRLLWRLAFTQKMVRSLVGSSVDSPPYVATRPQECLYHSGNQHLRCSSREWPAGHLRLLSSAGLLEDKAQMN